MNTPATANPPPPKYVAPHLRNRNTTKQLSFESSVIAVDGERGVHVVTEKDMSSLGNTNSYSYCFWLTLQRREVGWCSIIHRGYAEFDRCPGLWLCADCNKLHLRVSSFKQANFGKSESNHAVEVGVPVHVAIVVDGSQRRIQLYMDGELDFQKALPDRKDDFLPGRGPLYVGRDPWHQSSSFAMAHFALLNKALGGEDVQEMFQSQQQAVRAASTSVPYDSIFSYAIMNEKVAESPSTSTGGVDLPSSGGLTATMLAAHDESQQPLQTAATSPDQRVGSVHSGEEDKASCSEDHQQSDSEGEQRDSDRFLDSLSLVQSDVTRGAPPGPPASTATSQYTVKPWQHLRERQEERDISLRDLQLARKHGVCYESRGKRLVYAYQDVIYVTDSSGSRGITAWRLQSDEHGVIDMHVPNLFEIAVSVTTSQTT